MPIDSKYYTQEQIDWINENWSMDKRGGKNNIQLTAEFNNKFGINKSHHALESKASEMRCGKAKGSFVQLKKEDDWICENYYRYSRIQFIKAFNDKFRKNVGRSIENRALSLLQSRGLYKGQRPKELWNRNLFTKEMIDWILDNKPIMTSKELLDAFNKRFDRNIKNYSSLKRNMYYHGRSLAEVSAPVSDVINKNQRMPIGTIIEVPKRKLVFIKVKDVLFKDLRKWQKENTNGNRQGIVKDPRFVRLDLYNLGYDEMPDDMLIVHLDGDWRNCSKDNCVLVERRVALKVWKNNWNKNSVEIAKVGIEVAKAIRLLEKENLF